ncbi:MAG: tricarboxylate transporter [Betaproteobacteria bacterium RIFCSPLOWO2_02_FULL_67_26]|nr:MAG: tricarboxylate transporter [Betaproteobacteria bacterium RIFCSPLOWO2_02_FULL_67_26]
MLEFILAALVTLFDLEHFLYLVLGTFLGLVVGILPGLGGIAGLSLLLPFVYGKDPTLVLPMMIGLLAVTNTSDTFPAVLMGIPGTSSAQATILDGFPLAQRGEAARALGAAFSASLLGGLFGAVVLTVSIYAARPLILGVGFGEQLMLILLALTMVGMLTGASALKGIVSCGFGLLLGTVGAAPATGEYRFAFDTVYLSDGIPLVIVGLAMFAVPEMVEILRRRTRISSVPELGSGTLRGFAETLRHKWLVVRCSAIGTLIGALPGLGGSVTNWVAYGHVVQSTKDRDMLGKGDIRGVIGPESANNSDNGGALVPTLMFGIPGSGSMAVFLGGLILIGVEPGIGMLERHLDLTFLIIWSLALANVIGASACLFLARPIARLTLIPFMLLAPFMIVIIYFAAYQATQSWADLAALFILGVLGMYMKRFGWSRPALLIGFVLAVRLDAAVYQSVQVYGMSFLERTGVQVMLVLIAISVFLAMRFKPAREPLTPDGPHAPVRIAPQAIFLGAIIACVGYVIFESSRRTFLASVFPMSAALISLALLCVMAVAFARTGKRPSYLFHDSEREWQDHEKPAHSELHFQAWMLGLLGATALAGFVLGVFAFITAFLRLKAGVVWHRAALAASGAIAVLAFLSHVFVLDYPTGLLQRLIELPWPLN